MKILEKLTIKNFKSIREQELKLGRLNVFIGGNGVGKSNFIQIFRLLREISGRNLAGYTIQSGGADGLLYFGRKMSNEMEFRLEFGDDKYGNNYEVTLMPTDQNSLFIKRELISFHNKTDYPSPKNNLIGANLPESNLKKVKDPVAHYVNKALETYRIYHFHDTSNTAHVKGISDINDNQILKPQAENLPAFLYWLQEKKKEHFQNIQDTVRQIAPFFDRFILKPSKLNENQIRLEWKEKGSDNYFNATSLSDGTLRFICLTTLLLQPKLPEIIMLDEPELGLHPAAIRLLADLLSSASTRTQVIVATQSVTLVNQFTPKEVWTVDREDSQSVFGHLNQQDMKDWLDDYSLGELWEKNLLGARP